MEPELLERYIPKGVELDLYQGVAYVSLVGFLFKDTRLFGVPVPFLGTFEEINLRFYLKRVTGGVVKRGVVFINETVPYRPVAWLANKLYGEHYIAIPTKHQFQDNVSQTSINYSWKINNHWNELFVKVSTVAQPMLPGSIEEFIFEHYYGYTKLAENLSQEYKVNHPRWLVKPVEDYNINCDFTAMYGPEFSSLENRKPDSIMLAAGSMVTVDWKRTKF